VPGATPGTTGPGVAGTPGITDVTGEGAAAAVLAARTAESDAISNTIRGFTCEDQAEIPVRAVGCPTFAQA
jgi:hypothetical protein